MADTLLRVGGGQNFDALLLRVNGLGDRLIFNSNRSDTTDATHNSLELYSMRTDGTELTQLTSAAGIVEHSGNAAHSKERREIQRRRGLHGYAFEWLN